MKAKDLTFSVNLSSRYGWWSVFRQNLQTNHSMVTVQAAHINKIENKQATAHDIFTRFAPKIPVSRALCVIAKGTLCATVVV